MSTQLCGEIITRCSKCDLDLNHLIILVEDGSPKRVKCLTCQGEHTYRDAKKAVKKAVAKAPTQQDKTRARQSFEEKQWREKIAAREQTPIPYKPSGSFKKDALIYHVNFGTGLIVDFIHPDKMQVYFDGGLKTLKGIVE